MRSNLNVSGIAAFCLLLLCFPRLEAAVEVFPEDASAIAVSMDFQDVDLKDILKALSIQSGYNFIASEAVQNRKITLFLDQVPIKEALDKIFKANNLSYDLYEAANIIIVKDWGKAELETVTKIFPLKHAAVSTSALLNEIKEVDAAGKARGGKSTEMDEVKGLSAVIKKMLTSQGSLIEDPRTNSLIVTDIPSRMPLLEQTIALLDVSVPQVLIEVEMLDVSKNVVDKLGVEHGANATNLFTMVLTGATRSVGFPFKSWEKTFPSATDADVGTLGINSGTNSYQLIINYLRTQTDTKYLARPRLLTLNNETAEISITKDEVVGRKETTTTGDVATTSIEYIRSTDLSLTPEGVGVYLRVTPQISPETGEITMVIHPKTSVTSTSTLATTQADAEVRTAKAIVKVKDGETVMLGGLIHTDKSVAVKKMPILGDIPILGMLFRNRNQTKDQERELLVFITPHIIRDGAVELAQIQEYVMPEREQGIVSGMGRTAVIEASLDTIEKPEY